MDYKINIMKILVRIKKQNEYSFYEFIVFIIELEICMFFNLYMEV